MKKKIFYIILILSFVSLTGFGCKKKGPTKEEKEALKPVTINYWRVFDGKDAFQEQINHYQELHSHVTINYRRFRFDEYEKELLNALAEDRGPDVFSIPNTWIRSYKNKILTKPDKVTTATQVIKRGVKKEVIIDVRTRPTISLRDIKNNFIDVVSSDVILKETNSKTGEIIEKVYGLPLSVDTLAMYYNKDLLNNAGIPQPPTTWSEFQQQVKKITQYDIKGDILLSGAAIGTINNVSRGVDLLSLLMMQNGAVMMTDQGQVAFHLIPEGQIERSIPPGLEALLFYTDFASPIKEVYTWNDDMSNSIDAFVQGKVAFVFGYSYHLPIIKQRAPKLNLGIAPIPQIPGNPPINFANYWVEVVSKKTKNPDIAWDFVEFLTKPENAKIYLEKTKKPTALRVLIPEQLDDIDIGTFASQLLTAKSWYRGEDMPAVEKIFSDMVEAVLAGSDEPENIIENAAYQVQNTVNYE